MPQDLLDGLVHLDQVDSLVGPVFLAHLDLQGLLDQEAFLVALDFRVHREKLVPQVHLDLGVSLVNLEDLDLLGLLDYLDHLDQEELQVR